MSKMLLSSFIVAGAAIGSGVLALPIVAAKIGIVNAYLVMLVTLFVAYKISIHTFNIYKTRYGNKEVNVATLALEHLGVPALTIIIIINVLNMGLCCASYLNVGGDLMSNMVLPIVGIHIDQVLGMGVFLLITFPIFVAGIGLLSKANGLIFATKMVMLFTAIFVGVSFFKFDIFKFQFDFEHLKYLSVGSTIFFCIWGMQMTLPIILRMNDFDVKKSSQAVVVGLSIISVAYFGWIWLIYSLIPESAFVNINQVSDILLYIQYNHPELPSIITEMVSGFTSITVLTAFFSLGYSLVVFTIDLFKWKNTPKTRVVATLLAFILPSAVSIIFAKQFVLIYKQSSIFLILCALVPLLVSIKEDKSKIFNIGLVVFCLALIVIQIIGGFYY